jgi:hypothetical protein
LALKNESNSNKLQIKNRTAQSLNSPTTTTTPYANGAKTSKPGLSQVSFACIYKPSVKNIICLKSY